MSACVVNLFIDEIPLSLLCCRINIIFFCVSSIVTINKNVKRFGCLTALLLAARIFAINEAFSSNHPGSSSFTDNHTLMCGHFCISNTSNFFNASYRKDHRFNTSFIGFELKCHSIISSNKSNQMKRESISLAVLDHFICHSEGKKTRHFLNRMNRHTHTEKSDDQTYATLTTLHAKEIKKKPQQTCWKKKREKENVWQ